MRSTEDTVRTPSATIGVSASTRRERPPARDLAAERAVAALRAGAGQHEVAQPGQPRERRGLRARAVPSRDDLGEAARDQRRPRVLARGRARPPGRWRWPSRSSARRPARRPARRDWCRGGARAPASRALELGRDRLVRRTPPRARRAGPAPPRGRTRARRAPRPRRPGSRSASSCEMRQPCRGSRPFVAETSTAARRDVIAQPRQHRLDEVRGHRDQHGADVGERLARVRGHRRPRRGRRQPGR